MNMNKTCVMSFNDIFWKKASTSNIFTHDASNIVTLSTHECWVLIRVLLIGFLITAVQQVPESPSFRLWLARNNIFILAILNVMTSDFRQSLSHQCFLDHILNVLNGEVFGTITTFDNFIRQIIKRTNGECVALVSSSLDGVTILVLSNGTCVPSRFNNLA